jgi:glutamine synthetase
MPPTRLRQQNVTAAQWTANGGSLGTVDLTATKNQIFGANVFGTAEQRQRLPKDIYKRLQRTLENGEPLDTALADAVAAAMKDWALEHGATHYTHWFQPLTGLTPRSTTPSTTRPATARRWPSSPARSSSRASPTRPRSRRAASARPSRPAATPPGTRRRRRSSSRTPTARCCASRRRSRRGRARRWTRRSRSCARWTRCRVGVRALRLFGDLSAQRVFTTVGAEQEYFLVDEQYFYERPDLINTGRTLFGAKPPKGHELDDHYFGSIPERVLAYMLEAERELQKLGVPVKTRHNEVAPNQYELAPIFENSNVGSDHQQLTMQILQNVARRYGLVCLLHEKPFAGVNGSGKHNNWSMGTDTGQNLLEPGDDPSSNLRFLFFCAAVIAAVDKHQALLRASVANAGQDHRLGANEAPPAIISIFLGDELTQAFQGVSVDAQTLDMGAPVLPRLPMHGGDRNRTSPFAFTGNKFEFRALGSSMSLAFPNTVLNTIVAESIDALSEDLENAINNGSSLEDAVTQVVKATYAEHSRIVFDGDGYSQEWHDEAEQRGLVNLRTTPDALPSLLTDTTTTVFSNYNVLDERELEARYEVSLEQYVTTLNIEAETAAAIARTQILPAAVRHVNELAASGIEGLADEVKPVIGELHAAIVALEKANAEHPEEDTAILDYAVYMRDTVIPAMLATREVADRLEKLDRRRPVAAAQVRGDALHQVVGPRNVDR